MMAGWHPHIPPWLYSLHQPLPTPQLKLRIVTAVLCTAFFWALDRIVTAVLCMAFPGIGCEPLGSRRLQHNRKSPHLEVRAPESIFLLVPSDSMTLVKHLTFSLLSKGENIPIPLLPSWL